MRYFECINCFQDLFFIQKPIFTHTDMQSLEGIGTYVLFENHNMFFYYQCHTLR